MEPDSFSFDVFLSHNRGDKDRVRGLAATLRDSGLRVWFDEWEIKPGDDIYLAVERGLETSRVLVLCLSPAALGSGWVELERSTALFRDPANRSRRFVPVLLSDCELPDSLRRYRYIDLRRDSPSAIEELLVSARSGDADVPVDEPDDELQDLTKRARRAVRRHRESEALRLWGEVRGRAKDTGLEALVVRADLEMAFVRLKHGADLDEVLTDLDRCLEAASSVALGRERSRLLQLIGETHRIKRNWDRARGVLTTALDLARSRQRPDDEGWAFLSLAVLEHDREGGEQGTESELIDKAYDCFSAAYASGEEDLVSSARQGFAGCHLSRAKLLGHRRFDDAMAEYARAIDQYQGLGTDFEWDVANVLFDRAELQSRMQEPSGAIRDLADAAKRFEALEDHLGQAKCVLELATLLDSQGHRSRSLPLYEEAFQISLREEVRGRGAWMWFRLGCKLMEVGQLEPARNVLEALLEQEHLRAGQRLDIYKMLVLRAKAANDEDAQEACSQAAIGIVDTKLARAQSGQDRRRLVMTKGQLLADMECPQDAEKFFRRCVESFEAAGDRSGVIECWFAIAGLNRSPETRKQERAALERVLALTREDKESFFRPMSLVMLAQLDLGEERFEEARRKLEMAEEENEGLNNPAVWVIAQDLRSKLE